MINVIKANHQKEPFSEQKVIASIQRAGISESLQNQALQHVKNKLYEGISTDEIYNHISEFLGKSDRPFSKAKYGLKDAVMALGPTGYPFEDFVARLLEAIGYKAQVRQILNGKCITHEIDVIAEKDGKRLMIEAKFHNSPGIRSDVQVALYTKARFDDIKMTNKLDNAWIVTNTKTTNDANTYAACVGMKVISWNFPEGEGIRDLIEKTRLYPITMLTSLSQNNKQTLLYNHIVLCKDLKANPSLLDILPLSKEEKEKTISEVNFICDQTHD
ncbi:restriction endonuclease [Candidatus Roizmanbacteria bacterium]|nr:restriction endonuclease [Candidatus Roizmanbacteria bacterium]